MYNARYHADGDQYSEDQRVAMAPVVAVATQLLEAGGVEDVVEQQLLHLFYIVCVRLNAPLFRRLFFADGNSLLQVMSNSFSICDEEMQGIGVGIYGLPSLVNHSCLPNCVVTFDGAALQLRAIDQSWPGRRGRRLLYKILRNIRYACGSVDLRQEARSLVDREISYAAV